MNIKNFLPFAAILIAAASAIAQTNPPPPAPPANPQADSGYRFAYGGDVAQVPAQFVSNLVFLPVSINQGEPSLFLLDTTAATSSIDPSRAASLGLTNDAGAVHNAVLSVPGLSWLAPALPLVARDGLVPQIGRSYQGTLGLDFLSRFVVQIDYTRKSVQIYDPHSYTPPDKKLAQPLKWASGLPYVSCKFSVHGERTSTAPFLVDTSQPAGIVFRDQYFSAHIHNFEHFKTIPGMYGQETGDVPAAVGRLAAFSLEKFESLNLVGTIAHGAIAGESDSSAAGLIGSAYLRRYVLIFDSPHQQMFFEPNIHFIDRDDVDMSGLTILARGPNHKSFEVVFADPDGPAAHAGVQVGDIIAGIDDEAAADLSLDQVQDMFRQTDSKYKVLIERKGQTLTVNFQTRRLI